MTNTNLRIITLFLLILCIGMYFYTDEQKSYYDRVAIPAATAMLQDISDWQEQTLLKHLSDQAKQTLSEQQLRQLLNQYRQFGQLQHIDGLQFSRLASALAVFGERRINYATDASFSNGRAHINITLIPADSGYKIYNFTITPVGG